MTSQKYPTISFDHSPEMEARRLLHVAGTLSRNWFQKHAFLVLPRALPKVPTSQVVFPPLAYETIPDFWNRVSTLKLTTPMEAPAGLLAQLTTLVVAAYEPKAYDTHIQNLERYWNKIKNIFWYNLFTQFPTYRNRLAHIQVYSTAYGPYTTFGLAENPHSHVTIYVRQDSGIERLLWTILMCLFRPKMQYDLHYTWEEIEAVVDWLMSESTLAAGLKLTHPTIKTLRAEQIAPYRQESENYLASLGITHMYHLEKNGGEYRYGHVPIAGMTDQEQKLLDLLYTHRQQTVSYEDIAQSLWPEDEDWTLYAVVKAVERLRHAIRESGIATPLILAHRKLGYSLS